jgi:Na+-translocating ferredoxin:NAD+ oxidoreductase subunit E
MRPLVARRVASLLMLCPLLAVSDSVINALGLGVLAVLTTCVASLPVLVTLKRLPQYGRIAAVTIIVAGVVTCAQLTIHAWFYDLYLAIGWYVPLMIASGLLVSRYDWAAPGDRRRAMLAGLATGLKFCAALMVLGATREFVGHGSLLSGAQALPGQMADRFDLQLFRPDLGFVLAILPPGAFIAMGLLFAVRNWYWSLRKQ